MRSHTRVGRRAAAGGGVAAGRGVVEVVVGGGDAEEPGSSSPELPSAHSATNRPRMITTRKTHGGRTGVWRRRSRPGAAALIGCSSTSLRRSWRSLYSSTSSLASRSSASAYVRRKLLTYVGPGSRSHSSFSSARRYFARIFVWVSTSETSILARMRASRRVAPMSGIAQRLLVDRLGLGVVGGRCRRRAVALAQVGDEALDIARADEHLARLGALVAGDDAAPLEHVDE